MKNKNRKYNIILAVLIVLVIAVIALAITVIVMLNQLNVLGNRVSFVSDTADVILSDVSSLQSNIEATLEEESSLLESWNIELVETDFKSNTYTAKISIIPKEYTDTTSANIYFGTNEFPLMLNGLSYEGEAVLPLGEAYDRNVTVLFIDGDRKNTEVIRSYKDIQHNFKGVLSCNATEMPAYKEGKLQLTGAYDFVLSGNEEYDFTNFEIVVEADGKEIDVIDLKQMAEGEGVVFYDNQEAGENNDEDGEADNSDEDDGAGESDRVDSTGRTGSSDNSDTADKANDEDNGNSGEVKREHTIADDNDDGDTSQKNRLTINGPDNGEDAEDGGLLTIDGLAGTYEIDKEYEVEHDKSVRIYMRAVTTEGYRFEYDLFNGTTIDEDTEESLEEDDDSTGFVYAANYFAGNYSVYDQRGAKYEKE